MLDKKNYVFIIGAGASYPYKFPLGYELFDDIRDNFVNLVRESSIIKADNPAIPVNPYYKPALKFCEALRGISGVSIDRYLNTNKTFKEIGLIAIASTILKYETKRVLPGDNKIKDDWYTYLFMRLTEGLNDVNDLLKFGDNQVTFITFNYDRSLEYFLYRNYTNLMKYSGIEEVDILPYLRKLSFIHVYGQIGLLPFQVTSSVDRSYSLDYGLSEPSLLANGHQVSTLIEVMYESRMYSQPIMMAREQIKNADAIFFLGFGFDSINLEMLGFPIYGRSKTIRGTAFGKTKNEMKQYQRIIDKEFRDDKDFLFDCDSTSLLRDYLY